MQYFITFLEGLISFVSPCVLPLVPIYISYFASDATKKRSIMTRTFAFVAGFTLVFCILGVFAGSVGAVLARYRNVVNIVCGLVIIVLALGFLDIIPVSVFKGGTRGGKVTGIASAFAFGTVFSINLSPCVGVFLGAAIMTASASGTVVQGVLLLLCYSLGLGVPFVLSSLLIDKLRGIFGTVQKHYRIINTVCGVFLIVMGLMMMTGLFEYLR